MPTEFIQSLCAKIDLSPPARQAAFAAMEQYAKPLQHALSACSLQHIAPCTKRLWRPKKNAAFCLAFCLLRAEQAYAEYCEKGLPERVYYDSMRDIAVWANTLYRETGMYGVREMDWLRHTLYLNLFRIGRLQYQFFTMDTHIFPASERQGVPFSNGAPVLHIHIPEGEPLTLSACRASVASAQRFFAAYFPEYAYCGFVCDSWLLDANNALFMRENSNILQFRSLFDTVVQTTAPCNEITRRLWGEMTLSKRKIAAFPTDTDLQRRAKAYLLSGGKTGNGCGFLKK